MDPGSSAQAMNDDAVLTIVFENVCEFLGERLPADWESVIRFDLSGLRPVFLLVRGGRCRVARESAEAPSCVVSTDLGTLLRLELGELSLVHAQREELLHLEIARPRSFWPYVGLRGHTFSRSARRLREKLALHSSSYDAVTPGLIVVSIAKAGTHLVRPLMEDLGYESVQAGFLPRAERDDVLSELAVSPGQCVFTHELPLDRITENAIVRWCATGRPRILFNYRDPRAVVCSYVNFLMGRTASRLTDPSEPISTTALGDWAPQVAYAEIMHALPDDDARLMCAITDKAFPQAGVFEQALWLLQHPRVCKIRYEDLVGPSGGGTAARQREQIASVLAHLGRTDDPDAHLHIYDTRSSTFSSGRIDTWRGMFKAAHLAAFNERSRHILSRYGYPVVEDRGGDT